MNMYSYMCMSNRAPGPDDISIEFYQHCWEVVKGGVMNLFFNFHNENLNL
jgi:hypothetical protein